MRPAEALFARARRLLPSKRALAGAGILGLGTAIGQGAAFLSSPFLTRFYSPEQFGLLAIYIALMSNVSTIVALRYEVAIPIPSEEKHGAALVRGSLLISIGMCSLIALAVWFAPLARWLGIPPGDAAILAVCVPLATMAVGVVQILGYWHLRKKAYVPITLAKGGQSAAGVLVQILVAPFAALRPFGLVVGDLLGRAAAAVGLFFFGDRGWRGSGNRAKDRDELKAAMHEHREFPIFGSFSALFNGASQAAPVLGLTVLYGPATAGLFALSNRIIGAPIQFLGQTLSQVFVAEGSHLLRENPRLLRRHTLKLSLGMAALTLVPIVALAIWGPPIFALVFGPKWEKTGHIVRALVPMYLCDIAVTPVGLALYLMKQARLTLIWDATRFALLAALFVACHHFAAPLRATLLLLGGVMAFMNLVLLALILRSLGLLAAGKPLAR